MNQIHFIREICEKIIWCACSISGLQDTPFAQFCTDDPDKVTCRACRRTWKWKQKKINKLEVKP